MSTPSSTASRAVLRHVSWWLCATVGSGCSGFPWQLSALIVRPRSSTALEERLLLRAVAEQHVGIAVARARVVAGAELDGFDPERGHAVEHLLERKIREEHGEDAELHGRDRIRLAASREA